MPTMRQTIKAEITRNAPHPVHKLFAELIAVEPYPEVVIPVQKQIQHTSFFPGGIGLWRTLGSDLPLFPVGGVMVLGQDFDSVKGYEKSLENAAENLTMPTWKNLQSLLERVNIQPETCFFTNIYIGLRQGTKNTGRFPGAAFVEFKARCSKFLLRQIAIQKPGLILTLGTWVPRFLATLSPQLVAWSTGSFKDRDKDQDCEGSVRRDVTFDLEPFGLEPHRCVVASLVHPSLRGPNVHRRSWKTLSGDPAEIALLTEAYKCAFRSKVPTV